MEDPIQSSPAKIVGIAVDKPNTIVLTPNMLKKNGKPEKIDKVDTLDQQVNKILELQRKKVANAPQVRISKPKQKVKLKIDRTLDIR